MFLKSSFFFYFHFAQTIFFLHSNCSYYNTRSFPELMRKMPFKWTLNFCVLRWLSRCSTSHLLFYLSLSCLFSVFIFLIPSSQPVYLLVISMGPLPEIHAANSWPLSHFSVLNQVHFLSDCDSWIFWRFIDQAHFMPELEYCYKKRFKKKNCSCSCIVTQRA